MVMDPDFLNLTAKPCGWGGTPAGMPFLQGSTSAAWNLAGTLKHGG